MGERDCSKCFLCFFNLIIWVSSSHKLQQMIGFVAICNCSFCKYGCYVFEFWTIFSFMYTFNDNCWHNDDSISRFTSDIKFFAKHFIFFQSSRPASSLYLLYTNEKYRGRPLVVTVPWQYVRWVMQRAYGISIQYCIVIYYVVLWL